nr:carbon storage regulator [Cytophagales bacterium]
MAALVFSTATFSHNAQAEEGEIFASQEKSAFLFDESLAVEDENLNEMRGTALNPEILGIAIFDAVSANNSNTGTISGGNTIDAGAFSNSSGLSTIIQNSGNGVIIQSATLVNVSID